MSPEEADHDQGHHHGHETGDEGELHPVDAIGEMSELCAKLVTHGIQLVTQ
jgi:hypothetical protein